MIIPTWIESDTETEPETTKTPGIDTNEFFILLHL